MDAMILTVAPWDRRPFGDGVRFWPATATTLRYVSGDVVPRRQQKREVRLQQHRSIVVGDATLECTLCGSGTPVVLLANAGCSTGYFDHLVRALVAAGFQTIS